MLEFKGECWPWFGHVRSDGYAQVSRARGAYAHRFVYERFYGVVIPADMTVDHLCRNRSCVNPVHMEIVSRGENTLRGDTITAKNLMKTHCKHGHAFDEKNTRVDYHRGQRRRTCLTCYRYRLDLLKAARKKG